MAIYVVIGCRGAKSQPLLAVPAYSHLRLRQNLPQNSLLSSIGQFRATMLFLIFYFIFCHRTCARDINLS